MGSQEYWHEPENGIADIATVMAVSVYAMGRTSVTSSERPDVGAAIDPLAVRLLGGHVRRRAQDHAHLGRACRERRGLRHVRRRAGPPFGAQRFCETI